MIIEPNGVNTKSFYQIHYKSESDMQDVLEMDAIEVSEFVIKCLADNKGFQNIVDELNLLCYQNQEDFENDIQDNYNHWVNKEREEVINDIFNWGTYFEPRIYIEETALKCGLIPFGLYDSSIADEQFKLLAYGFCDEDMSAKLEAYQYLTARTIDQKSMLYKILTCEYTNKQDDIDFWVSIVGQEVLEEIRQIYAKE